MSTTDLQLNQPGYNQVGVFQESEALFKFREAMQNFCARANLPPVADSIDKTADGKAGTILISHIQMMLDEYFFGLWSEGELKWQQIGNEIVAQMQLTVVHPVWGKEITRTGAAAITIMVDKVPDEFEYKQGDSVEITDQKRKNKNMWALDMSNKKSNALDMAFPKLKTECLKNAANSFGKLFGRDLNRKKQDNYNPLQQSVAFEDLNQLFELKKEALSPDELQNAERIINNKESNSYLKLFKQLQSK